MNNFEEGYEVVESRQFSESVRTILRSVELWDEVRWALDWGLNRDPLNRQLRDQIKGKVGIAVLVAPPTFAVFFEVNEEERIVTYTGLAVTL